MAKRYQQMKRMPRKLRRAMRREAQRPRSVNLPAVTSRADSADKPVKQSSSSKTRQSRRDGYVNMLNKYGTSRDNSTAYGYIRDGFIPDLELTSHYETNGLFSKIIDTPAEEAVKHGFNLGLKSPDVEKYIADMLDRLEWEEKASTAIKWARLYGGAIGVMLINDGRGIDEPLNWRRIRDIDEICVYERAVVNPDSTSMYRYDPQNPTRSATSRSGMPEYYQVNSLYGYFWVHESRCLIFRNGILPEKTLVPNYRFWGMPEYARISRELREAVTSHSTGVKMLERSVQAIYAMKDLANVVMREGGEEDVIKRLQIIDMARGILNSIAIDAEGESYDFKTMTFAGVKDVIDTTCNMLSAVTNIPQTVLFGRSPAGQNSTGESDLENYYNYVERIQKLMLRNNLRTLLDVIVRSGLSQGKLEEEPNIELKFNPLWSMNEDGQASVAQKKAQTQQVKAQTAQIYVDMGALDPTEVRRALAAEEEFSVEEMLDDLPEEELWNMPEPQPEQAAEGAEQQPGIGEQPVGETEDAEKAANPKQAPVPDSRGDAGENAGSVGVLVLKDGCFLTGVRSDSGMLCGPGGHIEPGETPAQAAIRETQEEFGITPMNLKRLGQLKELDAQYGQPHIFLCTEFEGEPKCSSDEMSEPIWVEPESMVGNIFPPFAESLKLLNNRELSEYNRLTNGVNSDNIIDAVNKNDGGPGSGRRPENGGDPDNESGNETSGFNISVKPKVSNPTLQNIVNDLYKGQGGNDQIGDGTTMDAVRNEIKTGTPTKRQFHSKKARRLRDGLKNLTRDSHSKLSDEDKKIAKALRDDLKNALMGRDRGKKE